MAPALSDDRKSRAMGDAPLFFVYYNKLGCMGSILVSVVLTLALILVIRLLNG